jgi:ankyrin repeat protein
MGTTKRRRLSLLAVPWLALLTALTATLVAAAGAADPPLVDAMARRDMPAVRALLKQRADVNVTTPDGATALLWAAHWDDFEAADLLLKAGANVNAADDHGVTPLARACSNASLRMVTTLLDAKANPNIAQQSGVTPLIAAIRVGSLGIVKALIARGADVNAATVANKFTPLMWAIADGQTDMVMALLEARANIHAVTSDGFSALTIAARNGDIETARFLIAAGVPVNETGPGRIHALPYAALSNQDAFAMFLLEQGADAKARLEGVTALHAAAGNATQFLSEWQRARNAGLGLAGGGRGGGGGGGGRGRGGAGMASTGKVELIRALLAKGADINAGVTSSAMGSSYIGRPTKGAFESHSCGTGDYRGATPLWLAAFSANVPVMEALLKAGADLTRTSDDGTTPLMVAAGLGRCTFNPALQRGARSTGAEAAVTLLLDAGADIHAVNEADFTALHGAAYRGLNEVIKILVDRGADINARDYRGRTPYRLVEGSKQSFQFQAYPETAAFMKSLGADTRLGVPGTVQERMRDIPATGQQ